MSNLKPLTEEEKKVSVAFSRRILEYIKIQSINEWTAIMGLIIVIGRLQYRLGLNKKEFLNYFMKFLDNVFLDIPSKGSKDDE